MTDSFPSSYFQSYCKVVTLQKQKRIKINDPVKKKKKKGTFLFHIHTAEKSRHAAGD